MSETQALQAREKEEIRQEATRPGPVFRPDVDILERGEEFVVYADLPGVDERSVEVRLERGLLALDAQLVSQPDPEWSPIHTEYAVGSFHREFRVSEDIDTDGVSATMTNGVLELRLPKTARHRPRSIPVQAG